VLLPDDECLHAFQKTTAQGTRNAESEVDARLVRRSQLGSGSGKQLLGADSDGDAQLRMNHEVPLPAIETKLPADDETKLPADGETTSQMLDHNDARLVVLSPLFVVRTPGVIWPQLMRRAAFLSRMKKFLGVSSFAVVRLDPDTVSGS